MTFHPSSPHVHADGGDGDHNLSRPTSPRSSGRASSPTRTNDGDGDGEGTAARQSASAVIARCGFGSAWESCRCQWQENVVVMRKLGCYCVYVLLLLPRALRIRQEQSCDLFTHTVSERAQPPIGWTGSEGASLGSHWCDLIIFFRLLSPSLSRETVCMKDLTQTSVGAEQHRLCVSLRRNKASILFFKVGCGSQCTVRRMASVLERHIRSSRTEGDCIVSSIASGWFAWALEFALFGVDELVGRFAFLPSSSLSRSDNKKTSLDRGRTSKQQLKRPTATRSRRTKGLRNARYTTTASTRLTIGNRDPS